MPLQLNFQILSKPLIVLICKSLKEIVIPYGTKSIGSYAFRMCENLKSIYIPDTVTHLSHSILDNYPNAIIYCTSGSYTVKHCKEKKISYLTDNSTVTVDGNVMSTKEFYDKTF